MSWVNISLLKTHLLRWEAKSKACRTDEVKEGGGEQIVSACCKTPLFDCVPHTTFALCSSSLGQFLRKKLEGRQMGQSVGEMYPLACGTADIRYKVTLLK